MLTFAAVGSIYFLLRLSKNFNLWNASFFVIFSTLGIYTHYFMFFTLAAQGIYLIFFDRRILLKIIILYAAVVVLFLPWIPILISQFDFSRSALDWIPAVNIRIFLETFAAMIGGKSPIYRPLLFVLSAAILTVGFVQCVFKKPFEKPYLLVGLWFVVPFILAVAPGLKIGSIELPFRPVFYYRYLIPMAIPFSMLLVYISLRYLKPLLILPLAGIIILSMATNFVTFNRYPTTFKQAYVNEVVPSIRPSDAIVTVSGSFAEVMYYRDKNNLENKVFVLPESLKQNPDRRLLGAYVENGIVKVADPPTGRYFELKPGLSIEVKVKK
jgi:hypothetical protein